MNYRYNKSVPKLFFLIGLILLLSSVISFVYLFFFSYRGNDILLFTILYFSIASMVFLCEAETIDRLNLYPILKKSFLLFLFLFICCFSTFFFDYISLPIFIDNIIFWGGAAITIIVIVYIYGFFIPYLCRKKKNPLNIFISFVFMFFSYILLLITYLIFPSIWVLGSVGLLLSILSALIFLLRLRFLLCAIHSFVFSIMYLLLFSYFFYDYNNKELFTAIMNGNPHKVERILDKRHDFLEETSILGDPLQAAMQSGRRRWAYTNTSEMKNVTEDNVLKIVKMLIKHGADVNKRCASGFYPLHLAVRNRGKVIISELIKAGANINAEDTTGSTPLSYLTGSNRSEKDVLKIMQILLNYGAKVNTIDTSSGNAPIHNASAYHSVKVVEELIQAGAEINVKNKEGETPLDMAIKWKNTEVIKFLQEHGAISGSVKGGN